MLKMVYICIRPTEADKYCREKKERLKEKLIHFKRLAIAKRK